MEMTVLWLPLGLQLLDCRRSQGRTPSNGPSGHDHGRGVRGCVASLLLAPAIRIDPLYLPWPLVITIKLLMPYLMLFASHSRASFHPDLRKPSWHTASVARQIAPSIARAGARKLLVCNLTLTQVMATDK